MELQLFDRIGEVLPISLKGKKPNFELMFEEHYIREIRGYVISCIISGIIFLLFVAIK